MVAAGFGPARHHAPGLQPGPFDHSGKLPSAIELDTERGHPARALRLSHGSLAFVYLLNWITGLVAGLGIAPWRAEWCMEKDPACRALTPAKKRNPSRIRRGR